jgi:drug/metabolite transporter (DMT)-like permease
VFPPWLIPSGDVLAFVASVCFTLSSFLLRIGQRRRPSDDGVFTTNAVNFALNLPLAVALGAAHLLPAITVKGVLLFVLGGVLTAFLGRILWMRCIRLLGPARANSMQGTSPLFATLIAVAALGERLSGRGWAGVALVISGMVMIGNETPGGRLSKARTGTAEQPVGPVTGIDFDPSVLATSSEAAGKPGRNDGMLRRRSGFLMGLASALSFGAGSVVRKAALNATPSAFVGAPISSATSLLGLLLLDATRGKGISQLRDHLLHPPLAYVLAGLSTAAGQFLNLGALNLIPVTRVVIIQGLQPVLGMALAVTLFRRHESLNWGAFIASVAIVMGVMLAVLR